MKITEDVWNVFDYLDEDPCEICGKVYGELVYGRVICRQCFEHLMKEAWCL